MDKSLLADATSTDDSPVSGYMLKEIARATINSYPACNQLIDYLGSRIKKNNRSVKYKCCVIIKHVCREGRVEFKREVSRILDAIKECLQFKGEVDDLRGDEPNRQVREAAKEALDAIFDSHMPVTVSSVAAANRIQAFGGGYEESPYNSSQQQPASGGSTSYLKSLSSKMSSIMNDDGAAYQGHPGATDMAPGPSGSYSGRPSYPPSSNSNYGESQGQSGGYESRSSSGMQGFGSGPDPREEKSWMQKIGDAASSAKDKVGSFRSGSTPETSVRFANDSSNYSNYSSNRGENAHGRGTNNTYSPSAPTNAGGLSGAASGPYGSGTGSPASQAPQEPEMAPGSGGMVPDMPNRPGYGRAGSAAQDGSYEQGVVAGLCEPGGMKAIPPQEKLQKFLNSASTLSPELVGSCLLSQLNEDSWQTRVKALMVISSLVMAKGCDAHKVWWADPDRVDELTTVSQSDSKASVRTQATKTMRSLGASGGVSGSAPVARAAPRQTAMTNHQAPISLLDDYEEPAAPVAASSSYEFDPMSMQATPAQAPPPVPTVSAPTTTGGESGGLFDGMDLGVSTASSAPVRPAQHTTSVNSAVSAMAHDPNLVASVSNLLDGTDPYAPVVAPTPAQAPTNTISSAFDGLNLIDADPVVHAPAQSSMSSFADLEPSFGHGSSGPAAPSTGMYPVAPPAPHGNGQMYPNQQQHMGQQPMGQQPYLSAPPQQYYSQQGYQSGYRGGGPPPQQPPAAPVRYQMGTMGSPTSQRKHIPGQNEAPGAGGSGFSFMGGGGGGGSKSGNGDSFSFVNDVIKSSGARK